MEAKKKHPCYLCVQLSIFYNKSLFYSVAKQEEAEYVGWFRAK